MKFTAIDLHTVTFELLRVKILVTAFLCCRTLRKERKRLNLSITVILQYDKIPTFDTS